MGAATKQAAAPSQLSTPTAVSQHTENRLPAFLDSDYKPPENMIGFWMVPFVGEVEQPGKCLLTLGPSGLTEYQAAHDYTTGNLYFGTKNQVNPPFVSVLYGTYDQSPYRGGTAWSFEFEPGIDLPDNSTVRCYPALLTS